MSHTSKSPRRVALAALATGMDALPKYSHECSPHTYTQPQMFACLALKRFFKTSYRGIEAYLNDMPNICKAIGLRGPKNGTGPIIDEAGGDD